MQIYVNMEQLVGIMTDYNDAWRAYVIDRPYEKKGGDPWQYYERNATVRWSVICDMGHTFGFDPERLELLAYLIYDWEDRNDWQRCFPINDEKCATAAWEFIKTDNNITKAERLRASALATVTLGLDGFLERKWGEFEDVPFDGEAEKLAASWWIFTKGTSKDDIWKYFDEYYSKGVAYLVNELEYPGYPCVEGTKEDTGLKGLGFSDKHCGYCNRVTYNIPNSRVSLCAYCFEELLPCAGCEHEADSRIGHCTRFSYTPEQELRRSLEELIFTGKAPGKQFFTNHDVEKLLTAYGK